MLWRERERERSLQGRQRKNQRSERRGEIPFGLELVYFALYFLLQEFCLAGQETTRGPKRGAYGITSHINQRKGGDVPYMYMPASI